jgi:hypothetical protein
MGENYQCSEAVSPSAAYRHEETGYPGGEYEPVSLLLQVFFVLSVIGLMHEHLLESYWHVRENQANRSVPYQAVSD